MLLEAPGVVAGAVVGVPDERLGERVVAVVEAERRSTRTPSAPTAWPTWPSTRSPSASSSSTSSPGTPWARSSAPSWRACSTDVLGSRTRTAGLRTGRAGRPTVRRPRPVLWSVWTGVDDHGARGTLTDGERHRGGGRTGAVGLDGEVEPHLGLVRDAAAGVVVRAGGHDRRRRRSCRCGRGRRARSPAAAWSSPCTLSVTVGLAAVHDGGDLRGAVVGGLGTSSPAGRAAHRRRGPGWGPPRRRWMPRRAARRHQPRGPSGVGWWGWGSWHLRPLGGRRPSSGIAPLRDRPDGGER